MRVAAIVVVAGLAGVNGRGQGADTVTVYLTNSVIVPSQVLFISESLAAKMFLTAGVRVAWRLGQPADLSPVCDRAVVVRIAKDTPANYLPGASAFALPFEREHITVFYDRVKQTVDPRAIPTLLAHVLVHEITHILQGIDRHSESGVMKAHWGAADYTAMEKKPLPFTDADVDLIHRGLSIRAGAGALVAARR